MTSPSRVGFRRLKGVPTTLFISPLKEKRKGNEAF
jgi:hypothetical protein